MNVDKVLADIDAEMADVLSHRDRQIPDSNAERYATGKLDGLATARAILAVAARSQSAGAEIPTTQSAFNSDVELPRPERPVLACRACGDPIVFLRTTAGKQMPVDAETAGSDEIYNAARGHTSHYATCPKGAQFRKKKELR